MYNDYLQHTGVLRMKWGQRKWQNPDGTWTEAGKAKRRAMYQARVASKASGEKKPTATKTNQNANADLDKKIEAAKAAKVQTAEDRNKIMEDYRYTTALNQLKAQNAQAQLSYATSMKQLQALNTPPKKESVLDKIGDALLMSAADLAKSGVKNVGEKYLNELLETPEQKAAKANAVKYDKAKKDADYMKNLLDTAKYKNEYENITSGKSTSKDYEYIETYNPDGTLKVKQRKYRLDHSTFNGKYYLAHVGVKNMHWGERNYQNEDGSYKPGAEGRYDPKPVGHRIKAKWKAHKQKQEEKAEIKRKEKIKRQKEEDAELERKIQRQAKENELKRLQNENDIENARNEQIRREIESMNMQQNYSQMMSQQQSQQKSGSDFVKKALVAGAVVGGTYLLAKKLGTSPNEVKTAGAAIKEKVKETASDASKTALTTAKEKGLSVFSKAKEKIGNAVNDAKEAKQQKATDKLHEQVLKDAAYKQAQANAYTNTTASNSNSNLFGKTTTADKDAAYRYFRDKQDQNRASGYDYFKSMNHNQSVSSLNKDGTSVGNGKSYFTNYKSVPYSEFISRQTVQYPLALR